VRHSGKLLALLLLGASNAAMAQTPIDTVLDKSWTVRIDPADDAATKAHPRAAAWFPAHVPGSVQQDLIASGQVPDPFLGQNEGAIQWAGLTDWQYRTTITATPGMLARGHVDLVLDGLDTFAQVYLNGTRILSADNAHRQWRVAVKDALHPGENVLEIRFASPIKTLQPMVLRQAHPLPGEYDSIYGDEPEGKQTSPYIRKPKYHYGWDWGPRIVNIGPWRNVHLQAWDSARIDTMRVTQEALGDASARLMAGFTVQADHAGAFTLRASVTAPDGTTVPFERSVDLIAGENHVSLPLDIAHPQRWWPAGYGAQPLYTVTGTLGDANGALGSVSHKIGLRKVELLREKDTHGRGFAIAVNGVPIFAKGANVIPFDSFPARVTPAKIRSLLGAARDANMNMLRVWGGGIYPDDAFYEAADEMGLMVWQDFMFGGAVTPPIRPIAKTSASRPSSRSPACNRIPRWCCGRATMRFCRAGTAGTTARPSRRPWAPRSRRRSASAWRSCSTACCARPPKRAIPMPSTGPARPAPITRTRPIRTMMATAITGTFGAARSRSKAIWTPARASCPNMGWKRCPT
jgi:beta-mannosidase